MCYTLSFNYKVSFEIEKRRFEWKTEEKNEGEAKQRREEENW